MPGKPPADRSEYVLIGRLIRAHGLTGEIRVYPLCSPVDLWRDILDEELFLAQDNDDRWRPVRIRSYRPHGPLALIRFHEADDRTAAEALGKADIWMRRDRLPDPGEETFYFCDVEGAQVVDDESGQTLGRIRSILDNSPQPLLVIQRETGPDFHIPFVRSFIVSVDPEAGEVRVRLPEGLVEVNMPDNRGE